MSAIRARVKMFANKAKPKNVILKGIHLVKPDLDKSLQHITKPMTAKRFPQ